MRSILPMVFLCALGLGGCAKAPPNGRPASPSSAPPAAAAPAAPASVPPAAAAVSAEPASVPAEPVAAAPSAASPPAPPTPKREPRERRAVASAPKSSETVSAAPQMAVMPPEAPKAPEAAKAPAVAKAPEVAQTSAAAAAPTEAPAPQPTLDLASLEQRLRDTHAIGLFTKLSLKNQVDDLLAQFRAFYDGQSQMALPDLHQRYDLLLMKVLSLLQNADPPLATDISASRSAIWSILSDPKKFAQLHT